MKKYMIISLIVVILLLVVFGAVHLFKNNPSATDPAMTSGTSSTQANATDPTENTQQNTVMTTEETTVPADNSSSTEGSESSTTSTTQSPANPTTPTVTPDPSDKDSLNVEDKDKYLNLTVGDAYQISYTYSGSTPEWRTSNSTVATVSSGGKVTAKAAGKATLTVTVGSLNVTIPVDVVNKTPAPTPTLTISPTSMNLTVGGQGKITATYTGSGSISYTTSNASVATVTNDGTVIAKAAGNATITVTAGSIVKTCEVKVTAPVTLSLTISTAKDTKILVGKTLEIKYSYNGDPKNLTWSVTDPSVLTVNSSGVVTGVGAGRTSVKVTDGTLTASVRIIVEKPAEYDVKATSISDVSSNAPIYNNVVKYAGDSMTYTVTVAPVDACKDITVTSSNNNVVSVSWSKTSNLNDIKLNFKSAGSATITITSADGCASKSYTINVQGSYGFSYSGDLSTQQYCNAAMQVAQATTGATPVSSHSYYRVMTIDSSKLTWSNARNLGRSLAHEFYGTSSKICITFVEINADGNYVFHIGF